MRQIVPIILVLAILTGSIFSAPEEKTIQFEHLSSARGLSQNSVTGGILQDSKGFMWFATEDGLNKYDGYTFTVYRHDPANPLSLSENNIEVIIIDDGSKDKSRHLVNEFIKNSLLKIQLFTQKQLTFDI